VTPFVSAAARPGASEDGYEDTARAVLDGASTPRPPSGRATRRIASTLTPRASLHGAMVEKQRVPAAADRRRRGRPGGDFADVGCARWHLRSKEA
jgi:hypothetical protein